MQRLKVSHLTEYQFTGEVTLEPHRLLIRPREGHDTRIESSTLDIFPTHDVHWTRDVYNNSVATVNFHEPANRLSIYTEVIIAHYDEAPLDFIVEDYAVNFPFKYQPYEETDLLPFLKPNFPKQREVIKDWLKLLGVAGTTIETYVLLERMSKWLNENIRYVIREEAGVQSPSVTLASGSGSCRDYATLFIEACRQLGLASRFVSGYVHAPQTEMENAATHAWAEVYLPGAGWKGFDPTTGELTASKHIAVAVSRHPERIPPVSGSFVGDSQTPTLNVNVQVTAL